MSTEPVKFLESADEANDAKPRMFLMQPPAPDFEGMSFNPDAAIHRAVAPPAAGQELTVVIQESSFRRPGHPREVKVKTRTGAEAKTVLESIRRKRAGLSEGDAFGNDMDNSFGFFSSEGDGTFLQMLGGPFSKQLYLADYLKMHAECFFELHHNPLARRAVQMQTDFVVGRGLKVQAQDDRFQEAVDNWIESDDGSERVRQLCFDLSWQGEVAWRLYVKAASDGGGITVRSLDPSTLWEKITLPSDVEKVFGWWQQYPGPFNIYSMMQGGQQVPMTSYTLKVIPADEVLHVAINIAYGEKRGRSDLFPGLPWLKRIRDYVALATESAKYVDAFAWDVLVKGNAGDVQAALNDPTVQKVPRPGSAWWHNGAIQPTPMSSKTGSYSGREVILNQLVQLFAASFGIPLEFLGFSEGGTKATAIAATSPWAKWVQMRQSVLEQFLKKFFRKLKEALVATGQLAADVDPEVEITWPEPAPEDVDVRMKRLAFMLAEGVIDQKTFTTMCAAEGGITTYNYEKMKASIQKDRDESAARGDTALNDKAATLARARGLGGGGTMSSPDKANARQASSNLSGKADAELTNPGAEP